MKKGLWKLANLTDYMKQKKAEAREQLPKSAESFNAMNEINGDWSVYNDMTCKVKE